MSQISKVEFIVNRIHNLFQQEGEIEYGVMVKVLSIVCADALKKMDMGAVELCMIIQATMMTKTEIESISNFNKNMH